jgi:D-amino peptidase
VRGAELVVTKTAVTGMAARLVHPQVVRERLVAAVRRALAGAAAARPLAAEAPVRVRLRFADHTVPQILEAIPGVTRADGYTVQFTAPTMRQAYPLIRLMYRFVSI